jgi:hypothetical protein
MGDIYETEQRALCAVAQAAANGAKLRRAREDADETARYYLASYVRQANEGDFFPLFRSFRDKEAGLRQRFLAKDDMASVAVLDDLRRRINEARAYERIHGIGSLRKNPPPLSPPELDYLNPDYGL